MNNLFSLICRTGLCDLTPGDCGGCCIRLHCGCGHCGGCCIRLHCGCGHCGGWCIRLRCGCGHCGGCCIRLHCGCGHCGGWCIRLHCGCGHLQSLLHVVHRLQQGLLRLHQVPHVLLHVCHGLLCLPRLCLLHTTNTTICKSNNNFYL